MSKEVGVPSCLLLDADASLQGMPVERERLGRQVPKGREGAATIAGCAACATKFVVGETGPDFNLELYNPLSCTKKAVLENPERANAKPRDIIARAEGVNHRREPKFSGGGGWD